MTITTSNNLNSMYKSFNIDGYYLYSLPFFSVDYHDLGDPSYVCQFCSVLFWYEEHTLKHRAVANPNFYICCSGGKIQLPLVFSTANRLFEL